MAGLKVAAQACALSLLLFSIVRCSDSSDPGNGGENDPEAGAGGRGAGGRTGTGGRGQAGAPGGSGGEATGTGGGAPDPDASAGGDGGADAGGADAGITRCQREVFSTALRSALPESPAAAAAADMDGDGDIDVIVLHREADSEPYRSWIRVLSNRGDGTFDAGERHDVERAGTALVAGDLNGDQHPDLVVGHGEPEGVTETVNVVSVLLNDGEGRLGEATSHPAGTAQRSVTLGDLNGDEAADIVVTNYRSGEIRILLNDGEGAFAAPVAVAVGPSPEGAAIADFDGDDRADIAVTDRAAAARVLLGQSGGGFAASVSYGGAPDPRLAGAHDGITATDFNGDDKPDLLVSRNARVLLGQGDGTFAAPVTLAGAPGGDGLAGDFDGDGKMDVAVVSTEGVTVRLGDGAGAFSLRADRAAAVSTSIQPLAADFDGDGDLDVAAADLMAVEQATDPAFPDAGRQETVVSGTLAVLRNAGDGTFDGETNYVVPTAAIHRTIAASDLNGDGRDDLVTTVEVAGTPPASGSVAYLLNAGGGVMSAPVLLQSGGVAPSGVTISDANDDGRPDLLVVNAGAEGVESNVGVFLGDASGGFLPVKTMGGVPGVSRVFAGQFDADPRPDLLVSGKLDTYLLPGQGGGNYAAPVRVDVPSVMHVADFDGDGDGDLIATIDTWAVHVRINRGDGTFEEPISLAVFWRPNWRTFAVSSADFDGNGKADVLVSSGQGDVLTDPDSTGTVFEDLQIAIFPSLGDGTFGEAFVSTPTLPRNSRPTTVATGDFDGDGHLDVVVGSDTSPGSGVSPSLYVLVNRGDSTFFEPVPWGSRNETGAIVTARLNDDGADDVALGIGSSVGVFLTRDCRE